MTYGIYIDFLGHPVDDKQMTDGEYIDFWDTTDGISNVYYTFSHIF